MENAKKCLAWMARIAAQGACSEDPQHVGYVLEELSQVLFERSGSEDRVFEPIPANEIRNLERLLKELELVNAFSSDMAGLDSLECAELIRRLRLLEYRAVAA
jgi:hypothetical protein